MAEAAKAAMRHAARARRVPAGSRCAQCGFDNILALEPMPGGWVCYECASAERGRSTVEAHHVLPRGLAPDTIEVPGNVHRELSEAQRSARTALIETARTNPLGLVILLLMSIRDFFAVMQRWIAKGINVLLDLLHLLETEWGPDWSTRLRPFHRGGAA